MESMLANGRISKEVAAELLAQLSPNPSPEKKKLRSASTTDLLDAAEEPEMKDSEASPHEDRSLFKGV